MCLKKLSSVIQNLDVTKLDYATPCQWVNIMEAIYANNNVIQIAMTNDKYQAEIQYIMLCKCRPTFVVDYISSYVFPLLLSSHYVHICIRVCKV